MEGSITIYAFRASERKLITKPAPRSSQKNRIVDEKGTRALSNVGAKLKTEMCKSHRLGSAKTDTGFYNYWKDLRPLVNKQATNAFWNNSNLKIYEKRNAMRYRTTISN